LLRKSKKGKSWIDLKMMERVGDRWGKMEGYCSTGQSPQRGVVSMEEEEEEEVTLVPDSCLPCMFLKTLITSKAFTGQKYNPYNSLTRLRAGNPGFTSRQEQNIYLPFTYPHLIWVPPSLLYNANRGSFPG
jgi:hypothetical protein